MVKLKLNSELSQSFTELIAENVGLATQSLDRRAINEKLFLRINALGLAPDSYYRLLKAATPESHQEWQQLISLLTNNETYFFRDKEQLNSLRSRILPELIERKQNKTLRICSAGCSTGEEPYSLAILLQELLPNVHQWQILLLGIDIDEAALQRARQGVYTAWSFRGVDEQVKQRYFQQVGNQYHLASEIKRMVKFKTVNLVKDPFPQPNSDLRDMDLLICRNVFIYFDSITIGKILEKIYSTLHPQGYFVTGHTELNRQTSRFQKQAFPESIVYRRQEANLAATQVNVNSTGTKILNSQKPRKSIKQIGLQLNSTHNTLAKSKSTVLVDSKKNSEALEKARALYQQKNYRLAIQETEKFLKSQPRNIQAHHLIAQLYANLGKYDEAVHYCYQALDLNSFFVASYRLLGQIAEEQGQTEEAKRILKKIIYLEPNSPLAYLDLSQIYQREGDKNRTIKMQQAALNLLKQLPPDTPIAERDNLTVAELIVQVESKQ